MQMTSMIPSHPYLFHLLLGEVDKRNNLEASTEEDAGEVLRVVLWRVELKLLYPVLLVTHQQSYFVIAALGQVGHILAI